MGLTFRTSIFLAILIFSLPSGTLALEKTEMAVAIADARRDAVVNVNGALWFGTGCLFCIAPVCIAATLSEFPPCSSLLEPNRASLLPIPVPMVGIVGTYFYQSSPPTSQLIGKSPEYVRYYTKAYKIKIGELRAQWASAGVVGGIVLFSTFVTLFGCL